jgi:hypothetical protein
VNVHSFQNLLPGNLRVAALAERFMALAKPGTEIQDGVPPENLSPDVLAKAVAVKDNSTKTVLAYSFALSFASSDGTMRKAPYYALPNE